MVIYLVMGITFGFAAGVQPGPLLTYLISRALSQGWRRTIPSACAPLVSDIPIVILILFILSKLPLWMEIVFHFAGGLFIFFLAWGAYKSYKNYAVNQASLYQSARQSFLKAVIVNLLNPNPYLSWSLVLGPALMKGWSEAPVNGIMLGIGFYGSMITTFTVIILLFSAVRRLGPNISRILTGISAIALALFGLYQIWLGIEALL